MAKTIGIVGGGQLGRLLALAARKLKFHTIVLDPTPDSPAGQVADKQIIGSFQDAEKIKELALRSDFLTFEIELANARVLKDLEKTGVSINPSPQTLAIIKDKLKQKELLKKNNIPVAEFIDLTLKNVTALDPDNISSLRQSQDMHRNNLALKISKVYAKFGFPFYLKARTDGYDGRGNALIKNRKDLRPALEKLRGRSLYAEKFVPFVKELAVMAARNTKGEIVCYPVVETTHENNICQTVVAPADISASSFEKASVLAKTVMEHLEGAGVFGIEMFLTKNGQVLVNEIAPRVHNSGHYTIEACKTSQFEQHIRAITGMELGSTDMVVPAAAMVNILGEKNGKAEPKGIKNVKAIAGVEIHVYGKMETRIDRKMGHITAVGQTSKDALEKALRAKKYITI